jgi:hypothetical protein
MMRVIQLTLACVAVLVATAGQVQAGVITTLFNANNAGGPGGAVYFDIDVLNPNGITIEKIFTNSNATVLGSMDIYTPAGWTLVSSGSGTLAGVNNPSEFNVSDFSLGFGVTGIAIAASSSWGHVYTNGNGSNQFYSNADLSLTLGSATNSAFDASVFTPRIWNGTIEYSTTTAVPEPSSLALFGIGACIAGFGAARRRRREKQQGATA